MTDHKHRKYFISNYALSPCVMEVMMEHINWYIRTNTADSNMNSEEFDKMTAKLHVLQKNTKFFSKFEIIS